MERAKSWRPRRRQVEPMLSSPPIRALLRACVLIFAVLAIVAVARAADTATPLDQYFDGLQTLRAQFTQSVKDAKGKSLDTTSGSLVVQRPGKFRWEVSAKSGSGGQLLVADGKNVWFLDKDLDQVTVKPADAALSSTPAMLLSGAVNLRDSFTLGQAGSRDGLDWVLVEPRKPEADFRRALFGFSKGDLRKMIIDDRLGQTATIELASVERNAKVDPQEVSFTPPKGTDVIGTPAK
jgi:outer membrane lipoprotein carrier protein